MAKCIQCGKEHNRRKFCSNKCKDRYHNIANPRGIFAHLAQPTMAGDIGARADDDVHPFSEEGLGQDYPCPHLLGSSIMMAINVNYKIVDPQC